MRTHILPPSPVSGPWRTFRIASAAAFLVLLDTTAVAAAYAPLRAHFSGMSVISLSWILKAYTVLFAPLLVPAGRLADLMGRKRLFLQGMALFSARAAFVGSAEHGEAINESLPWVQLVVLKRPMVAHKDLPDDRDQILRKLAEPEGRRIYWE